MQIKHVEFRKLRVKLAAPFKVAFGEFDYFDNILLKITTGSGIVGYGEAAPIAFVTGETAESAMAALEMLKPGLTGKNALAIDDIHAMIDSVLHGNSSVRCAIDLALHDIRGKAFGKPVYQLLGGGNGAVRNDVTVGIAAPAEMAEKARYYVRELGYRILKIKVGLDSKSDTEAVRLIREAVGENVRLRVDANQGYSVSEAAGMLEVFRGLGVEAIEQCLPYWDIEGAAFLKAKASGIQLMLDESIHGPRDALNVVRKNAADVLNIKLMKCGGLYPASQIAAIADAAGLTCMVGCMLETRLSITAGLSLVAAKSNVTEADCDSFMLYDDAQTGVTGGFTFERDMFCLSEKPGFGVEVDF